MPVRAYLTRVLIDEFDFSSDHKGVTAGYTVKPIEAPALQAAALQLIPGTAAGTIDLSGYYNGGAAGTIEQEIYGRLGSETPAVVSVVFDTSALGNPAYSQRTTWGQQMKLPGELEGLLALDSTWQDTMDRGYAVAHQTIASTGGQTIYDFGAAGTNGGWGALHVRAITGSASSATFTVQSAAAVGFSGPTTHGTFTVSAVGGYTLDFTGNVGRYVRLNCTSLGGATNISVTAIVGVHGVTQGAA